MENVVLTIGPLSIYGFGVITAVAVLVAIMVTIWQACIRQEASEAVVDMALYGVPASLLMARVYYVAANWQLYCDNPMEIFAIWHGGLALHGALLGFLLSVYLYAKHHKLSLWNWLDIFAPGLAIGQVIGQWGNFINQEAFGYPTDLPWGIYIDYIHRPQGYEQFDFFHPVFLYLSLWNLLIFVVLIGLAWYQCKSRRLQSGTIFLLNIILYAAGRLVVEGIRLDSEIIGGFRLAQIVSVINIIISLWLLSYRHKHHGGL